MKKRYVVSAVGLGALGYFMGTKAAKNHPSSAESVEIDDDLTFYNAGKPDQVDDLEIDQIENAKMVSEGSQFGVQYYSNIKASE